MQQGSAEYVEGLPPPPPDHLGQSSCHLELLKRPLFRAFFFKSASSGFQATSEITQSLVKALGTSGSREPDQRFSCCWKERVLCWEWRFSSPSQGDIVSCAGTHIHVWSINGNPVVSVNTFTGRSQQIICCCMSEMNEWDTQNVIVTGHSDGVVRVGPLWAHAPGCLLPWFTRSFCSCLQVKTPGGCPAV